jgi:hypothetical protein
MTIVRRNPPVAADAALERGRAGVGERRTVRGARPGRPRKGEHAALPVFVMPVPRPDEALAAPQGLEEVGWRYVEPTDLSPVEVWKQGEDFMFAAAGTTRARQRLVSALEHAVRHAEADDRPAELRLLIVRDAYLELVWVSFGDPDRDRLFVASRRPWTDPPAEQPLSFAELTDLLAAVPGLKRD